MLAEGGLADPAVAPMALLLPIWAPLVGPAGGGIVLLAALPLPATDAGTGVGCALPADVGVFPLFAAGDAPCILLFAAAGTGVGCALPAGAGVFPLFAAAGLGAGIGVGCPLVPAAGLAGIAPLLAPGKAGVGVGDALFPGAGWPEPALCAAAAAARDVASERIRISFISVPFFGRLTASSFISAPPRSPWSPAPSGRV